MNKKLLVGVGVAVLLILGVTFPRGNTIVERITAGAVSSPDILSPYFSYGGVRHWAVKMSMYQASTTICSFDSPAETTILTLGSPSVFFEVSSTTASNVVIATSSANSTATTTLIAQRAVGANGVGFGPISTTSTASLVDRVIAPNTHFNVSMSGGIGTFSPTGTCSATFRALN